MSTAAKSLGQRVAERVVPRVGRGLAVGLPILGERIDHEPLLAARLFIYLFLE